MEKSELHCEKIGRAYPSFVIRLTQWGYQNRWIFLTTLLVAVGVHYVIYANHLHNPDSLHIGSLYIADQWDFNPTWETEQGRWGLRLIDMMRGGINQAPLSAFLMLFFYSAAGLLLTRVFVIRSRILRAVIPLLIVCAPYVAEIETYHYCSAAYSLSFLLSISAVAFVTCSSGAWGWIPGAVCLLFALSMYQASLGVAAGLCVMVLVLEALQKRPWIFLLQRLLLMGITGSVGYYAVLKILLKLYDTSLFAPYSGGLLAILQGAPQGIANAYQDFVAYFTQNNTIAQNYYGQRLAYGMLIVLTIIALARGLIYLRQKASVAVTILLLLLLPAAVNITDVINANTHVVLRMAGALILVVPFCLVLLEKSSADREKPARWIVIAGGLCCVVLLRGYIVQINNDAMVMLAEKNKIVNLADRICLQLEQNVDYQAGAEVCILGEAQRGWYKDVSPLSEKASSLVQDGLFSFDPTFNARGWHSLYWEELGINMNWCSDERTRELCATEEFQNMPAYPQEGSIQTIDGVVVVKVAEIQ